MCVLKTTQAIIAIALLILGVIALFGIGITGLLFLVPGVAFAAIAGVTQGGSRAAVILALTADTVIAYFAGAKIQALLHPELMGTRVEPAVAALLKPTVLDFVVPSAVLALVATAVVAVLLDWRSVQAAAWFWSAAKAARRAGHCRQSNSELSEAHVVCNVSYAHTNLAPETSPLGFPMPAKG